MKDKKIAIITTSFPPYIGAGNRRIINLLRQLTKNNYSIYLFTIGLEYCNKEDYPYISEIEDLIDNNQLKIYRFSSIMQKIVRRNILLRKIFHFIIIKFYWDFYLDWALTALPEVLNIVKQNNINILFSSSPSFASIYIAYKIKHAIPSIKWIMDLRDPWVESLYHKFSKLQLYYVKKIEEYAFKYSDYITVVSKYMKELYKNKYKIKNINVLYNGFDNERKTNNRLGVKNFNENNFSISYTGILYPERKDIFIKFIKLINELEITDSSAEKKIMIYIAGNINIRTIKYLYTISGNSFNYLGNLSIENSFCIQRKSDILLLITGDISEFPSKLFEYINTGKTILYLSNNINPEIEGILKSTGSGICFNIDQSEKIKDFIKKNYYGEYYINPNKMEINKFNFNNSAKRLINIIEDF